MKPKLFAAVLMVLILLSFGTVRMHAQTTEGVVVGAVHDAQGAVAPGVKVEVTNVATGFTRTDTTNDTGGFRLLALPAGIYKLRAENSGFATLAIDQIEVLVGESRTVDLVMKVASQTETVEVTGAVATVDTETQHIGDVITQAQVTSLPLNGRDFAQLALLNPGVAAFGGGGGQQGGEGGSSGYSSNGQRSSSNNFMVDGVDNNNYNDGSVGQLPSIDSIEEFQVQTNNY